MKYPATQTQFFRKWAGFLSSAIKWTDLVFLLVMIFFFIHYLPVEVLNPLPATGGDTGSHFWPLWTLVHEALPNFQVRVLNPGNLAGEPHLTHYFPLPFLIMALLSKFMSLGMAFNIGSILPVGLLPICVYFCMRAMGLRFPAPIIAAASSLSFLYNESFSMWGGNTLSTMAGQFAHVYAFDFFLLGIGALSYELRKDKSLPIMSTLMFAGVLLSHFYVALVLPLVFIFHFIFYRRFWFLFTSAVMSITMALWFILPMLQNSPWTTAFGLKWGGDQLFREILPMLFKPFLFSTIFFLFALSVLLLKKKINLIKTQKLVIWLLISFMFFSLIFYPLFPKLGLVDVRMVPQAQLSVCLLFAILLSLFLQRFLAKPLMLLVTILSLFALVFWPSRQILNFPSWAKWNYSGWQNKSAYPELVKLSEALKLEDGFSAPRVVYENNDLSNSAGTVRVFEMLPYFAKRSTLESVYMQATLVAPAAFYLQSLVSLTPSCPFPNYSCTSLSLKRAMDYFSLLGVSDLILITTQAKDMAKQEKDLIAKGDFGFWSLYHINRDISLVETVQQKPEVILAENYKEKMYEWLKQYKTGQALQIVALQKNVANDVDKMTFADAAVGVICHPQIKIHFSTVQLQTDCPGKLHLIKLAYHPTWRSLSGEPIYLLGPGFMGIVPSQNNTTLIWGQHWLWFVSDALSWLAVLILFGFVIFVLMKRNKQLS